MEQLSGLDAMFIHAELHGMPMHISSLSVYDPSTSASGLVEFRDIVRLFEKMVHVNVPLLRCKLVEVPFNLDQPYWVEDQNFDLVYHVRHIALPRPGNWQKLCSLAANLHAQPLNKGRPLWEVYIIDGLDNIGDFPPGCFAVLLKVHHSIMDGRTGMAIFNSLHTLSANSDILSESLSGVDDGHFITHEPDMNMSRIIVKAALNNARRAANIFGMLGHSLKLYAEVSLALKRRELKELHKPKTRFNGKISPRRVVDRIRLPLSDIKSVKSLLTGSTVNDVAMTIIGGALRRYLLAKDELAEDSLVAAVPIDVRNSEDSDVAGNKINITNISLRTDIADPLDRMLAVHKEAEAGKAYARTLGKNIVSEVLDNLYAGLVSWGIRTAVESGLLERFPPANNTVISNVPGAKAPLFFCGAKLVDSFGMGPLIPNTGLFHTVSSTYDFLTIAFTADRQKMEDPDFYVQCLEDSYFELLEAVKEEVLIRSKQEAANEAGSPVIKPRRRSPSNKIKASSVTASEVAVDAMPGRNTAEKETKIEFPVPGH